MKNVWKGIVIAVIFAAAFYGGRKGAEFVYAIEANEQTERIVCIDPGHGGADPGKVGVDQVLEKDINLQISLLLKEELEKRNIQVVMTRMEDRDLAEEGASNRKVADLKERCRIMNESGAAVTICIHQNSFTDPAVWGAQVFYCSGSEDGKRMAQLLQDSLREKVDPDNHREIKENDSYYVLKNTGIPVVIVECGFLSNGEETEKLSDPAYQKQIAAAVGEGVLRYFDEFDSVEESETADETETTDVKLKDTAEPADVKSKDAAESMDTVAPSVS